MRKGVTADSPFTAPVVSAGGVLSSLRLFVALQDLAPGRHSSSTPPRRLNSQFSVAYEDHSSTFHYYSNGRHHTHESIINNTTTTTSFLISSVARSYS